MSLLRQRRSSPPGVARVGALRLGDGDYTIAGGVITWNGSDGLLTVDTESAAASDDLDTIGGGQAGDVIVVAGASASRVVTLKDGADNLALRGDIKLASTNDRVMLQHDGTNWVLLHEQVETPRTVIYTSSSTTSITNNSFEVVNYNNSVHDPYGLVTTGANWAYTAPADEQVDVTASINYASSTAWALGEEALLSVYVNGSLYTYLERRDDMNSGSTAQRMHLEGTATVVLSSGDTLDIRTRQQSGGSIALSGTTSLQRVQIRRVN